MVSKRNKSGFIWICIIPNVTVKFISLSNLLYFSKFPLNIFNYGGYMREASIFTFVSVKNTIFIWLPVFWWESESVFGFLQFCNYFVPILKSVINVYIFKRTIDGFWESDIRSGLCRQYWELSEEIFKRILKQILNTDFLKISLVFLWGDFKYFWRANYKIVFLFQFFTIVFECLLNIFVVAY